MTRFDVVVVSHRCRELLRSCLVSLREHVPVGEARIWVVDNASGDGTIEMLAADFPEVELIASETNLGFAAASNVGMERGRAPFVLVLNPDTRLVEPLGPLFDVMQSQPSVGIVGCRLVREDGTFDHAAKRSFPTPLGALAHFTRIGRWRHAPRALAQYRAPGVESGPVDAVNGAFMLLRRAALVEVGPFDSAYWMYMEDLDLAYRMQEVGWLTWYEPGVTVMHVKGGTTGGRRSLRLVYAFHLGMYRFYRRHYAHHRRAPYNAVVYVGIAVKFALAAGRTAVTSLVSRS